MLTAATPAPEPSEAVPVTAASALRNWAAVGELTVAVGAKASKVNWRVAALVLLLPLVALSVVVTTIVYDCPSVKVTGLVSADQFAKPLAVVALIAVAPAELAVNVEPAVQKPFALPVCWILILTLATLLVVSAAVPVAAASALRNCAAVGLVTVAVGALVS